MWIKKIKLNNFRNYNEQEIELYDKINIFYGENAQGKTNILEAVYMCSLGKSFRTNKEKELINLEKENAIIEIEFEKKDRDGKIKIVLNDKKNIFCNGIKLQKLSEILGKINVVIFSPDDIEILKDGPALRRKFLDIMIGQLRPNYIYTLNLYLKTLEQRNNYIKQIKFEKKPEELLEIWDEKLAEYGEKIYLYRKEFIEKLKNKIKKIHQEITEEKEILEIEYKAQFTEKSEYLNTLKKSRKIDIQKGYTTRGVHREDFVIYINNRDVSIYGSQGQNRTSILSLKLAQMQVIYDETGEYPVMLLDDFMSELDEKRRKNLLKSIKNTQVLITCTDEIKTEDLKFKSYNVCKGKIINKKQEV